MLATFLVAATTTILGDDTNFAGAGKWSFNWEDWSVAGLVQKENLAPAPGAAPFKAPLGNIDRTLGFRIGKSLATIAAVSAFLKSVDALVLAQGTLTLQPDAAHASTMVYAGAILKSAALVSGGDTTRGVFVTVSYKFECLTLV